MTIDIDTYDRTPTLLGQATAIEQSRAVAEVQAAVIVAQQLPRNLSRVAGAMRETCRQRTLADRAFYRFPRSGKPVTGTTIHLARELARCWQNITYGVSELRRDDAAGISEMQAYAWDLEANTRVALIFIAPHWRDTTEGPVKLPDLRSVYENNANQGARRLREAINAVLPVWYRDEAEELCRATLLDGGGKSLAQRVADAVERFEGIGVTVDQLAVHVGQPQPKWTAYDLAALGITYQSIQRGEVQRDDEFPPAVSLTRDILAQPAPPPPAPAAPAQPLTDDQVEAWQVDLAQAVEAGDVEVLQQLRQRALDAGRPDLAGQVSTP